MTLHEQVIVQAALCGAATGKPTDTTSGTDQALVLDALEAWDAGAAVIHIDAHVSGDSPCTERLAPTIAAIRANGCDAILSLSCRSCGDARCNSDQPGFLDLRPELAPLDCASGRAAALAATFREAGTTPELRCSDARQLSSALRLRDAGLVDDPLQFQFFVDSKFGETAAIEEVTRLAALVPAGATWSARTRGLGQLRLNVLCLVAGGHVRTGIEDNPWLVEGVPATNQELVERVVRIVDDLDRPLATPEEARQILQLGASRREWRRPAPAPIDLRVASG